MKKKPHKRHYCDITRPSTTLGSRGQLSGADTNVATNVPFSLKPLRGRELEIARQQFAEASVIVTVHLNRDWALTVKDKIVRKTGPHLDRALNIGYIRDNEHDTERDVELVCGEGDLSNG